MSTDPTPPFKSARFEFADEPLARIAFAAGSSDQGHFTRTIKRQTGMTPAAFRGNGRSR